VVVPPERRQAVKIRIEGTAAECAAAAERLAQVLAVREHSRLYPNRPPSKLVRLYLDVDAPDPDRTDPSEAP
jgi:hypothetical protein